MQLFPQRKQLGLALSALFIASDFVSGIMWQVCPHFAKIGRKEKNNFFWLISHLHKTQPGHFCVFTTAQVCVTRDLQLELRRLNRTKDKKRQEAEDTPDSLATASAAKTAVASCRVSTMRMPSFSQATSIGEMCPPTRVNTYLTPWARSTCATLSPPCRGLIVSVCRGRTTTKSYFCEHNVCCVTDLSDIGTKTTAGRLINRGHATEAFLKVTCHTICSHRCFTTATRCCLCSVRALPLAFYATPLATSVTR